MPDRTRTALFFGGALAIGVGAIWFAAATLVSFARAVAARAPMIAIEPRDAAAATLGIVFLAFAAMPLVPGPPVGPTPRRDRRRQQGPAPVDGPAICMGVAMVGLVLSAFVPLATTLLVTGAVEARGYVACERPADERRAPLRWVRRVPGQPRGICPTSWRDSHVRSPEIAPRVDALVRNSTSPPPRKGSAAG